MRLAIGAMSFVSQVLNILGSLRRQKTDYRKHKKHITMTSELVEIESILSGSPAGLSKMAVNEIMKDLELSITCKGHMQ